jgi:hypothetical protein
MTVSVLTKVLEALAGDPTLGERACDLFSVGEGGNVDPAGEVASYVRFWGESLVCRTKSFVVRLVCRT